MASILSRRATLGTALLLALGMFSAPSAARTERRVALLVGNSTYEHIVELRNPGNDAEDLSAALRRLDFDVTTVLDADLSELNAALRAFGRRSVESDVALVFYAGHGIEVDGENYLLPVDARLAWDRDVEYETVPLARVLRSTEGAGLRVVILDACRNNPLSQSMRRTDLTRSISRGSFAALDERRLGNEALVAYATEAGETVPDGRGRNSPYTSALLEYVEEPLELLTMFRRVRNRVLEETNQGQRPWEYQSLRRDHYLAGESDVVTTEDDTIRAQQETVFWQSIANSRDPADFEAYLGQYPTGAFRALAANRVAALRGSAASDPPAVPKPREREAGEVFRDCPTCPEMVVIPAGRFRMGCLSGWDCEDYERPVHEVQVSSFALGVYEVTFEEYDRFVQATGHRRAGEWWWGRGRRPVVDVSWNDAVAYASWLSEETGESYRLPSESEWEYAAREGTVARYSWVEMATRKGTSMAT